MCLELVENILVKNVFGGSTARHAAFSVFHLPPTLYQGYIGGGGGGWEKHPFCGQAGALSMDSLVLYSFVATRFIGKLMHL